VATGVLDRLLHGCYWYPQVDGLAENSSLRPAFPGGAFLAVHGFVVRARAKSFSLLAGPAFAEFGRHSVIEPPARLAGVHRIAVGNRVFVGSGSWLQTIGEGVEVALTLGDGTAIAGSCVLSAAAEVRLGRKVLLARGVYIADHGHAFEDPFVPVIDQGITDPRPVVIEDGAWLGENVVVGPGVRIGRGSVVGANSVVLADVPARSVAVGAPAQVVRTLPSSEPQ